MQLWLQKSVEARNMLWLLITSLPVIVFCNEDATNPPNIIFILADDMGYGDLYGVYPDMNSNYKLLHPNLDKMMSQGIGFTDSYAGAPLCSPSRCTLMTGKVNIFDIWT